MDNFNLSRALNSVKLENENVHCCLKEVIETRKGIEAKLNDVETQLSAIADDTSSTQSSNELNVFKIQSLDKEVYKLEEQQKNLSEQINSLNGSIKQFKENAEFAINALTMKADNLCQLFLSASQIETDESEYMLIFDDINKLKDEITEKEAKLSKVKKELEEFVFYEASENQIEHSVSLNERQLVMNFLEDQLLNIKQSLDDLKSSKNGELTNKFLI